MESTVYIYTAYVTIAFSRYLTMDYYFKSKVQNTNCIAYLYFAEI